MKEITTFENQSTDKYFLVLSRFKKMYLPEFSLIEFDYQLQNTNVFECSEDLI